MKEDDNNVKKEEPLDEEPSVVKKEPLSLEELLAKKQAEEAAKSKVVHVNQIKYLYLSL